LVHLRKTLKHNSSGTKLSCTYTTCEATFTRNHDRKKHYKRMHGSEQLVTSVLDSIIATVEREISQNQDVQEEPQNLQNNNQEQDTQETVSPSWRMAVGRPGSLEWQIDLLEKTGTTEYEKVKLRSLREQQELLCAARREAESIREDFPAPPARTRKVAIPQMVRRSSRPTAEGQKVVVADEGETTGPAEERLEKPAEQPTEEMLQVSLQHQAASVAAGGDTAGRFLCGLCGHTTARERNLLSHIERNHTKRESRCTRCHKIFTTRHEMVTHRKDCLLHCPHHGCNWSHTFLPKLTSHLRMHEAQNRRMI
jgi:hypothetical protein